MCSYCIHFQLSFGLGCDHPGLAQAACSGEKTGILEEGS